MISKRRLVCNPFRTKSNMPIFETRAQGKLLLTGEYFVLDGATALAIPVRFGQRLRVEKGEVPGVVTWVSKNLDGSIWFEAEFQLKSFKILQASDETTARTLAEILRACQVQKPDFFLDNQSFRVSTQNDFPREWGLGTSSTLIAALARWTGADPYKILFDTLGGSGYDIACAYADGPILYSLEAPEPLVEPVEFAPDFLDHLYFVFLGNKQNSREGIARYRDRASKNPAIIEKVSQLTQQFLWAKTIAEFDAVLVEHEMLVSETIGLPRAKDLYFSDFWGEVKSLGAWGGDFVLVSSGRSGVETKAYFLEKGFGEFLGYEEILESS